MTDFTLRPWHAGDLDNLVKFANNYNIARYMTNQFPHPYSIENGKVFIAFATGETPPRILAIDVNGVAAGGIGVHPQHDIQFKNAELGYWLAEPYWNQGIMSRAVRQMVNYTFGNFDLERIFARPFGSNTASQKVLEKAGFRLEARFENTFFKDGEYLDELVYAVRR